MPSITHAINTFLDAESSRVSTRTVEAYDRALDAMASHLDGYGHTNLSAEELDLLDQASEGQEDDWEGVFCGTFGVEKALESYFFFYFWFLIRKVMAPVSTLSSAAQAGIRFAWFAQEQGWVSPELARQAADIAADAGILLPDAARLNELLYEVMDRLHLTRPEILEVHDGTPATITKIEQGRIWFDDRPVDVEPEASYLAEVGWNVNLTLGRTVDGWTIIELGNVYPMPLD